MASKGKLAIVSSAASRPRHIGKIAILTAIIICSPLSGRLHAQSTPDLAGNWQGTVEAGRGFRIVLKISPADQSPAGKGAWQGDFYTMGPAGTRELDVQSMALEGTSLRLRFRPDGNFDGKLSADGKSIIGTLRVGGISYALNLVRAMADTAWEVPKPTDRMPPDAAPKFEVATIKPSPPDWHSSGFKNEGRRIWCENETVDSIIAFAYGIHPKQIVGGPAWFGMDYYTADGFADVVGEPNYRQMQGMYRALLASRFNLAFHHETRELSAFVIRIGKGDPKLAKSLGDPKGLPDTTFTEWNSQAITFRGTNATMADVTWNMGMALDKPVVDQTGLNGRFDFVLRWAPDTAQPGDPNAPPSVFTAMQEQLGLKLEATKAPVDVLVIDHVDRPSPN
jgi:uncharacterized protein (TIGR03435 family)